MLFLAFLSSVVGVTVLEHALINLGIILKKIPIEDNKLKEEKLATEKVESEKLSLIKDFSVAQPYISPESTKK